MRRVKIVLVSTLLSHSLLMLPLEAKLTLVTISPTIVTMKLYELRFWLERGLLIWFLLTRLLTLLLSNHTLLRAHKLHRSLEIICWVRKYERIWGCVKFVS
jgi:hypothetical protein